MSSRMIDISPLVSERIGVWPGDVPYRHEVHLNLEAGDNLTLGAMHTTFHVGAHADAPSHYERDGQAIGDRVLDLYHGPCQVVEVCVPLGARIRPGDVDIDFTAPRLLFKTGSFPDPESFTRDFNGLSPELVEHAHARGVRLVGIDTPSIDPFDDEVLEAHRAVAKHDMAVLEGLVLGHVAPGPYVLVALPLRLDRADASPVRAALIPERDT
ncbi:MAG: cyclase family protein [Candidatus Krumholzibacteriia bacterium]